jgi:hypothetical protein
VAGRGGSAVGERGLEEGGGGGGETGVEQVGERRSLPVNAEGEGPLESAAKRHEMCGAPAAAAVAGEMRCQ